MKDAVEVEVINVTPELARTWLDINKSNRLLSSTSVEKFKGILQRGEWRLTQDAAAFSKDTEGNEILVNGQHRLTAIVETGIPAMMLVVRGMDLSSQKIMDTGRKRKFSDYLKMLGYSNASLLAATVSLVWRVDNFIGESNTRPTPDQALDLLAEEEERFIEACSMGTRQRSRLASSATAWAAFFVLVGRVNDEESLLSFANDVALGENLKTGDAALALHRWLVRQMSLPRTQRVNDSRYALALIIKAWNAHATGKSIHNLSWRFSGSSRESFPQPVAA